MAVSGLGFAGGTGVAVMVTVGGSAAVWVATGTRATAVFVGVAGAVGERWQAVTAVTNTIQTISNKRGGAACLSQQGANRFVCLSNCDQIPCEAGE